VGRYHYLGHAVPFGAHLRYSVFGQLPERAVVGCIQFSSAAWRIAVRDKWIGWDDKARVHNLGHVVNNSRFLVLPWIVVFQRGWPPPEKTSMRTLVTSRVSLSR